MTYTTKKTCHKTAGSGLLTVIFTMSVIAALVTAIYSVTSTHVNIARREVNRSAAVTYGDGVMESLFDQWRNAMSTVTNATDRTSGLSNASLAATLALPTSTALPPPAGVSVLSWSVTAQTPLLAPTTDTGGRPVPENGTASSLRVRIYYKATVTVQYYVPSNYRTATLERVFVRSGRNLFDNFCFGTQPATEFHPGASMYVSGTAYIGGDLYTASDYLHFTQDVTYLGTQTLDYHPLDSRRGSTAPTIQNGGLGDNWDLNNPPQYGSQQKLFDTPMAALDGVFLDHPSSNDTDSDGNNNNDGYHEMIEEQNAISGTTNPDPLQLDASTSERLSNNADYRIYVNASNAVTIYKGASTTPLATSNTEYIAINGALTTNTAIKDVREGDNVRVVSINVGAVRTAYNASTITDTVGSGDGLLFYVKDTSVGTSTPTKLVDANNTSTFTSVTSSSKRGVKLVNGAQLPGAGSTGIAKGFTVVSPNSVYIQGDYNTGKTGTSQPPSNTTTTYVPPVDNPNPYVAGYDRVPAAVVGDAVNVLSNAWNDINSDDAVSSRLAVSTTINTAIVAGNVPTSASSYSGGIENFIRFHEDWNGDYLTIYGSLALLYDSTQAKGLWSSASYSPPDRRWYYDPLLRDKNPPGFRVARTYERGQWLQH